MNQQKQTWACKIIQRDAAAFFALVTNSPTLFVDVGGGSCGAVVYSAFPNFIAAPLFRSSSSSGLRWALRCNLFMPPPLPFPNDIDTGVEEDVISWASDDIRIQCEVLVRRCSVIVLLVTALSCMSVEE